MAIIKITRFLMCELLQRELLLPNEIEALVAGPGDEYSILTEIEGLGRDELAQPIEIGHVNADCA